MQVKNLYLGLAGLGVLLFALSCRKDPLNTDPDAKLLFSRDTLIFDTVFTTVGSATHQLRIYNTSSKKVVISTIALARGSASKFRMNVDGIPAVTLNDIELAGRDSLYIFVEVTLDPANQNNPLVVTDSIVFLTNGNLQDVDLVAWGQDAWFHAPAPGYNAFVLPSCSETWGSDKPHVIYGYALIDTNCALTVNAGARLHFHNSSGLIALNSASLRINGTFDDPVVIEGDRLEFSYSEVPGQWDRIWLSAGSVDNVISYAVIRNGTIGLQADTFGNANPTLRLDNSVVVNMSAAGIFGQGARIEGINSVVANCGQYAVALTIGGDYRFRHCTFANHWDWDLRQTPLLLISNWYEDVNGNTQLRDLDRAYFGNCILYGSLGNEIGLDLKTGAAANYLFDHCVLRTDGTVNTSDPLHFRNISLSDPRFRAPAVNDYSPDTLSAAVNLGKDSITDAAPAILLDIMNTARKKGAAPDAGAFERE